MHKGASWQLSLRPAPHGLMRLARNGLKISLSAEPAFLPTKKIAFLVVLGPVDLATGKTSIENVDRRRASPADGRPIRQPDNNSGQRHEDEQDDYVHVIIFS